MKKLLYVKHSFHNKTKSNDFLQDILRTQYDIEFFDFNPDCDDFDKFKMLEGKVFDTVLLFQIMPPISLLKTLVKYNHIAFFPMYDATRFFNRPIWNEYRDCNIINFSSTLHKKCQEHGLSSYYIQYFPKPFKVEDEGELNSIFFWQRREKIDTKTIEKLMDTNSIEKLYLHTASDPDNKIPEPSKVWQNKIIHSNWFDTKDEMQKYIQKSALYFAPREFEGIGMSFLEAMAAGRCVISPDNPTMNEYIKNGETGYLYNLKKPTKIKLENIRQIQKSAQEYIKKGYEQWEKNKSQILDWIEVSPTKNSDKNLLDTYLLIKNPQKRFCCKIYTTTKNVTCKIFNLIPLTFKRSNNGNK